MLVKIKLKNIEDSVTVDEKVYQTLATDPYFAKIKFVDNLRQHSSGCVVFQRTWKSEQDEKRYETETIYLHKWIAEHFLAHEKKDGKNLAGHKNGNKLDCSLENLMYRSRAMASRQRKTSSKAGYTGVYQEGKRYRAVIAINHKSVHLGMYDTPEEAAEAYNEKSKELYGSEGKQNIIPSH